MTNNKKKKTKQILKVSIIFWIVVFLIYGFIFGPLLKDIPSWPKWVIGITIALAIILPIIGQGIIIYNQFSKKPNPKNSSHS